jgi:oligopeptide transport system permease protein
LLRYALRRLLQSIPVFFGATFLIFVLVYALPGDPVRALFGERLVSPATVAAIRDQYNLNDPLLVQYAKYIGGVLTLDFGTDFRGRPVSDILAQRFPVTLRLTLVAFVFEAVIGIAAGVIAGLRRKSFADTLVLVTTVLIVSIPVFVLGYALQYVLGVRFGIFPIAGVDGGTLSLFGADLTFDVFGITPNLILPGFVLGAVSLAYIARLLRNSLAETMRSDHVRTARAKGLSRRQVVNRHGLRNSLIPVVTFLGVDLGQLMAGAIVTEGIFNVPGIGQAVFRAIQSQEYAVVVGIVTALVLVFILANLVVDLLYAWLDPRIRYS